MNKLENIIRNNYGLVIFIIFLLGLFGILGNISSFIQAQNTQSIYNCFQFLFFPNKYSQILRYILSVGLMFFAFTSICVLSFFKGFDWLKNSDKIENLLFCISFYFSFSLLLCFIHTKNILLLLILIVIFIIMTFVVYNIKLLSSLVDKLMKTLKSIYKGLEHNEKLESNVIQCLILIFSVIFFLQFAPFVFKEMKVINEFSDIPEQTILNGGTIVDNHTYEKQNDTYNVILKSSNNDEVKAYIKANKFETHWKNLSRWAFHHHSHVLGVCNELELGRDKSEIFAQYGIFSTNLIRKAMKVFGEINYQNYFKLFYSINYLYFGLMFLLSLKIFKNKKLSLILLLSVVISINIQNYLFIYLAPGFNPMRHFFDIFVIFMMYEYLTKAKKIYLALALLFSLIAVTGNCNMGIFMFLAIVPTIFYNMLEEKRREEKRREEKRREEKRREEKSTILMLFIASLFLPFAYKLSTIGADYTKEYFTSGMLGWELSSFRFILILLCFIAFYIIFLKLPKDASKLKYFAFYLFLYCQGLLLYFIWGSDIRHLMVIAPIIFFFLLCILKLLFESYNLKLELKNKILNTLIIIMSISATIGFIKYAGDYSAFEKIFKTHVTYNWNLPKAKFISTMNPEYFTDSIELIQKYSKNENSISIISKYDTFIPFLADKYSNMPYLNLEWYIFTDKELNHTINYIKKVKPAILYVDKNIMIRDHVISPYGNFAQERLEHVAHIDRVKHLDMIFNAVKNDYELIDSSYLLNIYRRK